MKRTLTCALAAAGALAFAAPASADPALDGTYSMVGGSDQFYATVTSSCVTEGCTAGIVSNRGWTSVATLTDGRWNFSITKPDGAICDDGNFAPGVIADSLDAATLAGTVSTDSIGQCPGGQVTQGPVQLQKVG